MNWRWLLVIFAAALMACGQATASPPAATSKPIASAAATAQPTQRATAAPVSPSGLQQIAVRDLPPEARQTLELIQKGGPFPYDRDGVTFQNRERLLPRKAQGYYREFTVPTPGESDRGARRLITGKQGEIYYTADHYTSFVEVVP